MIEVFTVGGGEYLVNVFNAVASWAGSGGYRGLIRVVMVMAFTWAAAIFDFMKTLPAGVQSSLHLDRLVAFARQYLPLFDLNLGWLLPACLGFVIGLVIHLRSRKRR